MHFGKRRYLNTALFLITALVIGYALYCSNFTSDDGMFRGFGNTNPADIFRSSAGYGNGRLLGNALVQVLVISNKIRAPLQTLIFLLLCALMFFSTRADGRDSALLPVLLLMSLDRRVFGEVYLWCSGFCNYVPGLICMLGAFLLLEKGHGGRNNALLFFVSFCGQLFVETNSVVCLVAALLALLYYGKLQQEPDKAKAALFWLAGCAAGIAVMFAIPRVFEQPEWVKLYRSILWVDVSDMRSAWYSVRGNISAATDIVLLDLPLMAASFYVYAVKIGVSRGQRLMLIAAPVCALAVRLIWSDRDAWSYQHYLYAAAWLPYLYASLVPLIWNREIRGRRLALASLFLALVSSAPFFIMANVCYRAAFQPFALIVFALLVLYYNNGEAGAGSEKTAAAAFAVLLAALDVFIVLCFLDYSGKSAERYEYINEKMSEGYEMIFIPKIENPYAYENELAWSYGFYKYYNEPGDLTFVSVDYDTWLENRDG